jgi:hypothetical protein
MVRTCLNRPPYVKEQRVNEHPNAKKDNKQANSALHIT